MKNRQFNLSSGHAMSFLVTVITFLALARPAQALGVTEIPPVQRSAEPAAVSPNQALAAIKASIQSNTFSGETERIDFVREWVNQNSLHLIDKEHNSYAFNTPKVLIKLWQTYTLNQPPPHLSCGPRALAMQSILKELGIQSRLVDIFTDNYSQILSHTFLEVYNRDTNSWEIQDPDFNLYYVDLRTQKRVTTTDLIWGNLDVLVPQSATGQGWEVNNVGHLKQNYFEAMMYLSLQKDKKSIVLVNRGRFDPKKVFKDNGSITFTMFANKSYRTPIILASQGDNGAVCQQLCKFSFVLRVIRHIYDPAGGIVQS